MKRLFFAPLFFLALFALPAVGSATEGTIHVFVASTCPHCADFKEFVAVRPALSQNITYYEIRDQVNINLFTKVQERMPSLLNGVPTIIIDGKVIQGYDSDETTGKLVEDIFDHCLARTEGCISFDDFLGGAGSTEILSAASSCIGDPSLPCEVEGEEYIFNFWFIGETDLRDLSLPALSLILGGLDGFNPCAMWVLITLLTLLINTRSWPKIFVIGGTFLFVSGLMYYLFMAAWLETFRLIGFNFWIQKIIGIVAIGAGGFYLYEAFGKNPNECKVTDMSTRQKIIARMKSVMQISSWPLMIIGVAVLAFSVNLIELVCTAGLPAIFTGILAQSALTRLEHYWYLLLYIIAYMFDDLVVYCVAIGTLHATGLTSKYQRFTLTFGGVLMAALGFLLIFFPQVLTFG